MNNSEAHKKILAVQDLLLDPTISLAKLKAVSTLLKGVHPDVDAALTRCEKELDTFEKIYGAQIIELSVGHLPEDSEEQKRRKKALLLIIGSWNKLKSEVARVNAELTAAQNSQTSGEKASHWGRIFHFAKRPFGIITILAVGAVVTMQQVAVQLTITNSGCGTMTLGGAMPFSLPGLSLPKDPIPNNGSGVAQLPPLTVSVDGTEQGVLALKALVFSTTFQLPNNISEVTMDGIPLLHKKQDIKLSGSKQHTLTLRCR